MTGRIEHVGKQDDGDGIKHGDCLAVGMIVTFILLSSRTDMKPPYSGEHQTCHHIRRAGYAIYEFCLRKHSLRTYYIIKQVQRYSFFVKLSKYPLLESLSFRII